MTTLADLTNERLREQAGLDAERDLVARNKAGQFATPPALAADIVAAVLPHLSSGEPVRFLEPAVGSGAFVSALLANPPAGGIGRMVGVELDPRFAALAARLWGPSGLSVVAADFTATRPVGRFNLLIANPPYVRHHHIGSNDKRRLQSASAAAAGEPVSGLAGLHVHFMLLADAWLAPGGLAAWLVPGEFLDVNYGRAVRGYLARAVDLIQVHRFAPPAVQFDDALVSSAVVIYRKASPASRSVAFSAGVSVSQPSDTKMVGRDELDPGNKWGRVQAPMTSEPRLGDLFRIHRGLATGGNEFFIRTRSEAASLRLPAEFLRPILPSPRYLTGDAIEATADGFPRVTPQLVLLDCRLPEREVADRYPSLWDHFKQGVRDGISAGYLCSRRNPWYAQENRAAAPFVVPYMGRGRSGGSPFRFILNHSRATTANVYLLLYPRGSIADEIRIDPRKLVTIHAALQQLGGAAVGDCGRVYGGGLQKIEPRELASLPAAGVVEAAGLGSVGGLFDTLPRPV